MHCNKADVFHDCTWWRDILLYCNRGNSHALLVELFSHGSSKAVWMAMSVHHFCLAHQLFMNCWIHCNDITLKTFMVLRMKLTDVGDSLIWDHNRDVQRRIRGAYRNSSFYTDCSVSHVWWATPWKQWNNKTFTIPVMWRMLRGCAAPDPHTVSTICKHFCWFLFFIEALSTCTRVFGKI